MFSELLMASRHFVEDASDTTVTTTWLRSVRYETNALPYTISSSRALDSYITLKRKLSEPLLQTHSFLRASSPTHPSPQPLHSMNVCLSNTIFEVIYSTSSAHLILLETTRSDVSGNMGVHKTLLETSVQYYEVD